MPTVPPRLACRIPAVCFCAVLLAIAWSPSSADSTWPAGHPRPRIGLALSGGGARGAAHVGVLRVLEEHRIPIDYVAGTSMGALVGGLYASGLSPAQLDSVISTTDWTRAFADNIPRAERSFRRKRDDDLFLVKHKPGFRGGRFLLPAGVLDGQRVDLLLKRLALPVCCVRDFDRLAIPYRAVATDIVTGDAVVLDRGDLALAMRASMSIPAAFAPREIDGRLLVDGGVVDNFPIDVVRRMGADIVIAVDIATPALGREELCSVSAISTQVATLASELNKRSQLASLDIGDVLIRPDLGRITMASFDRAAEAIPLGARAAEAALPRLERLALPSAEYEIYRSARAARAATAAPLVPAAVRIVNRSRLSDEVIARRLDIVAGVPLDPRRLEKSLDRVYGLELFESVYYDVTPGDTMTITAREREWGPNYLQAGVAVLEDFEHPNFNLSLAYSRTAIDRLNGEWRTGAQVGQEPAAWTEFHQPLDPGLRTFVEAEARAAGRNLNLFDARGHKLAELGVSRFGGTFAVGTEIGAWGEWRCGLLRESGMIRVQSGDAGFPETRYDTGEAFTQLFFDRLDEVAFPHSGGSLRVRYAAGVEALGSGARYEQWDVEATGAATLARWTGTMGALLGTTSSGEAPLERRFCLGGLGLLSGLEQDERIGQHALLLRGTLDRRLIDLPVLPVYAGVSGEYGNVFATRSSIGLADGISAGSVFLGFETVLGPLCIAYGRADGGRSNYYLTLGQPLGGHRPGFRVH